MAELTKIQAEILRAVHRLSQVHGLSPTLEELRQDFGYKSINAIQQHLRLIEKKGHIKLHRGKSRGIQVLIPPEVRPPVSESAETRIPIIGKIAAGLPLLASPDSGEFLSLPISFLGRGNYFSLRITGESMTNAGIYPGDIAVIRHQSAIENGDIAAIIIEDEATLKYFFRFPGRIVLKSANSRFPELVYDKSENKQIRLAGRLAGLVKRMD